MIHGQRWGLAGLFIAISGSWVSATNLNVTVTSGGSGSVVVAPGATVNYEITGELDDALNEGLALVLLDLSFSGGALTPANAPTSAPMNNFDRPLGATNPAGFGGTVVGGNLVQVCGSQNTIKNTVGNAAFPIGNVIPGVAQPGSPQILVTGSLTAPMTPDTYTLSVTNVAASVIRDNEDGTGPFWAVDLAGTGSTTSLVIAVSAAPIDPTVDPVGARYLAIGLGNRSTPFALLVTPVCAGGVSKYVGPPSGPDPVARLVDNPMDAAYLSASQWNVSGAILYVTGPDIYPGTPYRLETDLGTPGSPNLLPPETATTWFWGDANGDGNADVGDILCLLDGFAGIFASCSLVADDFMPFDPDQTIDVSDILSALDGFSGLPYVGPSPCP